MSSKETFFNVVIPTRERCDTFQHALRTCVVQDYENAKILVSDNFSQDATGDVVGSFNDPRIHYVNTGKRLSMTANYEFALSHVENGYVIFIGDDDGLLPGALKDLDMFLRETKAGVVRWNQAQYVWPSFRGGASSNYVQFPLRWHREKRDSSTVIQQVIDGKRLFKALPMLYIQSAADIDVVNKIKAHTGHFYHSMTPDVYSGFALAGGIGHFMESGRPYSIGGTSHNSGSLPSAGKEGKSEALLKYLSEDNLPFHTQIIRCSALTVYVIEAFLQARDHLPYFSQYRLNMETVLRNMMRDAVHMAAEAYNDVVKAVQELGTTHNIQSTAQQVINTYPNKPRPDDRVTFGINLRLGQVVLDGTPFGLRNIYDASILCGHMVKLKESGAFSPGKVLRSNLERLKRKISRPLQNS
jgi:glycosyltransferase involved in cell wall biosynthesis